MSTYFFILIVCGKRRFTFGPYITFNEATEVAINNWEVLTAPYGITDEDFSLFIHEKYFQHDEWKTIGTNLEIQDFRGTHA